MVTTKPKWEIPVEFPRGNPGTQHLSCHPARYRWSSARYYLGRRRGDALCAGTRFDYAADEWRALLRMGLERLMIKRIEKQLSTGWLLGDEEFVKQLQRQLGRTLRPRRPDPPKGFKRRRRRRRRLVLWPRIPPKSVG